MIDHCYSMFSTPFWWSSNVVVTSMLPLKRQKSLVLQVVKRVLSLSFVCFVFPGALSLKLLAEVLTLFRQKKFVYLTGQGKGLEDVENVSILSWNICALPGSLPLLFGGVLPISERIEKIAETLLQEDCDLICLQEAHDVNASYTLYHRLKERYKHFYINIGTKPFSHNSGLFVASKKELFNILFIPFTFSGKQFGINKGMICFDIEDPFSQKKLIVHTHLQPGNSLKDQNIRLKEFKMCQKKLQEAKGGFLVGDLNIDRNGDQTALQKIKTHFKDPLENRETATNSLIDFKWQQLFVNKPLSIDYTLIKEKTEGKIDQKLVKAYDLNAPSLALSDHHAIKTIINKRA